MPDTFTWPIRVYYEDTDVSGVVYHANYLRFFERARTEWLRALGHGQEQLRVDDGIAFTVANLEIDFVKPARLDDELIATVDIKQLRSASLHLSQGLYLASVTGTLLARCSVRIACVDQASFRPRPLPPGFFDRSMKRDP